MSAVCDELGPDDGVDPRDDARARVKQHRALRGGSGEGDGDGDGPGRVPGRKGRQLGRQVAETLDALLAGETRDACLRDLIVVSAVPAPDASRLLVTVAPRDSGSPTPPAEVLERLGKASGWLRAEVASAVTRKRAPSLAFRYEPSERNAGPAKPEPPIN